MYLVDAGEGVILSISLFYFRGPKTRLPSARREDRSVAPDSHGIIIAHHILGAFAGLRDFILSWGSWKVEAHPAALGYGVLGGLNEV